MQVQMMRTVMVLSLPLAFAACDLLEVSNPGPIDDAALNEPAAASGLVVGMSADLSVAMRRSSWEFSVMGDELRHSGTHSQPTAYARGVIPPVEVNLWWGEAQRARWVAENGIERLRTILGANAGRNDLFARANVLAGFANRLLGEHVCVAVIDGGPAQDHRVHFERARDQFTEALQIATQSGNAELLNAALAGRASVRAALGDWAGAIQDAQAVPATFRYEAIFSLNTAREENLWPSRTQTRGEYTVHGSQWMAHPDDPRVPWEAALTATGDTALAADGSSKWVRQRKYLTAADNIALAKGTEMLLLRAEAALRQDQTAAALALVNEGRAVAGLDPLSASTAAEVWAILHVERGATLWLEGRRLWDLRRWYEESGPAYHPFLEGRDTCVPPSANEVASNRNL